MGLLLLLPLIVGVVTTFLFKDEFGMPNPAAGIVFGLITFCPTLFLVTDQVRPGEEQFAVRDTVDIQSAVTGSNIQGSFVLGSGKIGSTRYYAYWTSEGTHRGGAVERRKVSGDNWDIEVIETDSIEPRVIFTEYKKDETFWRIYMDSPYQRAEIFVPEGSVRYNYKLKAK